MIDYDPPEAFREVERTARKQHLCCECGEAIKPGTRYSYVSGVWDGHPDSYKTCLSCRDVGRLLPEGYLSQGLREQVWNELEYGWRPPEGAAVPSWVTEMIERMEAEA